MAQRQYYNKQKMSLSIGILVSIISSTLLAISLCYPTWAIRYEVALTELNAKFPEIEQIHKYVNTSKDSVGGAADVRPLEVPGLIFEPISSEFPSRQELNYDKPHKNKFEENLFDVRIHQKRSIKNPFENLMTGSNKKTSTYRELFLKYDINMVKYKTHNRKLRKYYESNTKNNISEILGTLLENKTIIQQEHNSLLKQASMPQTPHAFSVSPIRYSDNHITKRSAGSSRTVLLQLSICLWRMCIVSMESGALSDEGGSTN